VDIEIDYFKTFSVQHYPSFWIPISTSLHYKYLTREDSINVDCDDYDCQNYNFS